MYIYDGSIYIKFRKLANANSLLMKDPYEKKSKAEKKEND